MDVARVVEGAAKKRGAPACVGSDNGPEFISIALQEWAAECDSQMRYVMPGSPRQNGCGWKVSTKSCVTSFCSKKRLRRWRKRECSSKSGACSRIKLGGTVHWGIKPPSPIPLLAVQLLEAG